MIEKRRGETVMLSCTNNNPPTLASAIRWVQDGAVLQSLSLSEESEENTVTYTTQANEGGVYQCQVLSTRDNALLVVNVTLTVDGGMFNDYYYSSMILSTLAVTGGANQVQPRFLESIMIISFLFVLFV